MQVVVIYTPVRQLVNQRRISMKIEYDGLIYGKQTVEVRVRKAVRMFALRSELEQIDHVHETKLQVRELIAKDGNSSQSLYRSDVASAGDYNLRLSSPVCRRPFP